MPYLYGEHCLQHIFRGPSPCAVERRIMPMSARRYEDLPTFSGRKGSSPRGLKGFMLMLATLGGLFPTFFSNPPPSALGASPQATPAQPGTEIALSPAERSELKQMLSQFQIYEKAYQFFEDARHPKTGMVLDRLPVTEAFALHTKENTMASIAATGYSLALDVLKAEQGFFKTGPTPEVSTRPELSRRVVAQRLSQTLNFVETLSKPENGYFLPHFLHWETGTSMAEISTVDTALFYLGALAAGEYCGGEELARVERMFNRLDFNRMRTRNQHPDFKHSTNLSHGLDPNHQFIPHHWGGPYSEGVLLLNLLAMAQPAVPDSVWSKGWDRSKSWRQGGLSTFTDTPLFIYFYGPGFLPLKGLKDAQGEDYWRESEKAVLMQQEYCREKGYPSGLFGITACDAPPPIGYKAYHPGLDDGTIAPPAILASLPLAEKPVLEAMRQLKALNLLDTKYGPVNAYNVFSGWKTTDALGIDVASMILMLDAYEAGTIHGLLGKNRVIQRAYQRAGLKPAEK